MRISSKPMFSKRHHRVIAATLKASGSISEGRKVDVIITMADMLSWDNIRFNRKQFIEACLTEKEYDYYNQVVRLEVSNEHK